jgi:hypothetical protein
VVINQAGIDELVNDPTGAIARNLEEAAETIVVPTAQDYLSVPWGGPYPRGQSPDPKHERPPLLRTGALRDSVMAQPATLFPGLGLVVFVTADAINPHTGWPYGILLRDEGYRYIPESDDYQYIAIN